MTTTRELQLAYYVKLILDITFGLLLVACVGLALWLVLFTPISKLMGMTGTASIPVSFGTASTPQVDVSFAGEARNAVNVAYVTNSQATLRLETDDNLLIAVANAAKLVIGLGLAYIVYLLRGVVRAIHTGEPFSARSDRLFRRLAHVTLALGIVVPLIEYVTTRVVLNRLAPTVPELYPGSAFDSKVILATLLILLLAHVWSYGLELERDRALTV